GHPANAGRTRAGCSLVLPGALHRLEFRCAPADASAMESGDRSVLHAASETTDADLRWFGYAGRSSGGPAGSADQLGIRSCRHLYDGQLAAAADLGALPQGDRRLFGADVAAA